MDQSNTVRLVEVRSNDGAWGEDLDAVLVRIRNRAPAGIPEAVIERDALDAVHEARRMIRTRDG